MNGILFFFFQLNFGTLKNFEKVGVIYSNCTGPVHTKSRSISAALYWKILIKEISIIATLLNHVLHRGGGQHHHSMLLLQELDWDCLAQTSLTTYLLVVSQRYHGKLLYLILNVEFVPVCIIFQYGQLLLCSITIIDIKAR